jgi:hypothetical protein
MNPHDVPLDSVVLKQRGKEKEETEIVHDPPSVSWKDWKLPKECRVLVIISSKGTGDENTKSFKDVDDAVEHVFASARCHVVVLMKCPTTHEHVSTYIVKRGPWDVIHIVAHTDERRRTPHFPSQSSGNVVNAWSTSWWTDVMSAARPQLLVLSCCYSKELALAVEKHVGICICAEGTILLEAVPTYLKEFYKLLLTNDSVWKSHCTANETMEERAKEVIRERLKPRNTTADLVDVKDQAIAVERMECHRGRGPLARNEWDLARGHVCDLSTEMVVASRVHALQARVCPWLSPRVGNEENNVVSREDCALVGGVMDVVNLCLIKEDVGVDVVGWPGFGKTRLCREILCEAASMREPREHQKKQVVIFYIPCGKISWADNVATILRTATGIQDAEDVFVILDAISKRKTVHPVWLLDNFDEAVHSIAVKRLPHGSQIRLRPNACPLYHFSLRPLQNVAARETTMSHLKYAICCIPCIEARTWGDRTIPQELVRRVFEEEKVDSVFLKRHPVWIGWSYDDPQRTTCDLGDLSLKARPFVDIDASESSVCEIRDEAQRLLELEAPQERTRTRKTVLLVSTNWGFIGFVAAIAASFAMGGTRISACRVLSKDVASVVNNGTVVRVNSNFYYNVLGVVFSENSSAVWAGAPHNNTVFKSFAEANAALSQFGIGMNYSFFEGWRVPFGNVQPSHVVSGVLPHICLVTELQYAIDANTSTCNTGIALLVLGAVLCAVFGLGLVFVIRKWNKV